MFANNFTVKPDLEFSTLKFHLALRILIRGDLTNTFLGLFGHRPMTVSCLFAHQCMPGVEGKQRLLVDEARRMIAGDEIWCARPRHQHGPAASAYLGQKFFENAQFSLQVLL